jgi:hypothetical protein
MSFTIRAEGLVADVVEHVTAADNQGDTEQFEAVRAFVLAELETWPTDGVTVEASGHHDSASRNITIVLRPLRLGTPED